VLYEGGIKVDIILVDAEPMSSLVHLVNSSPYKIAIDRGMRVLHERPYLSMDRTRRTPDKATAASSLEVESKSCIDHALMKLAKASMLYARGDMDRTSVVVYSGVRPALHALYNMRSRVSEDAGFQTKKVPSELKKWVGLAEIEAVNEMDSDPDPVVTRQKLLASITLASRLASEIAKICGFPYPSAGQEYAVIWLDSLFGL